MIAFIGSNNAGRLLGAGLRTMILFSLAALASGNIAAAEPTSKPSPAKTSATPAAPATLGDPLAEWKMEVLEQEMISGLKTRNAESDFLRFRRYLGLKLDTSAGAYSGTELTGNCRLKWYERMLRNPLKAPAEAERFTRELHRAVLSGHLGYAQVLATAREKLDLRPRSPIIFPEVHSAEEALDVVKQSLIGAQVAYAEALAPLTKSEINELATSLYPTLCGSCIVGHTVDDRGTARRMCDLMEKMDRGALLTAAEALAPLSDRRLLQQLGTLPEEGNVIVRGASGRILRRIETPAGAIVVGSREKNVYHLDQMEDVAAVIDLGGGDEFYEGTTSLNRPVLLVVDLGDKNLFSASKPGVQGGAILGVSMLVGAGSGNVYKAQDVAQGSCMAGVGILLDFGGHDKYQGVRRVQGSAIGGLGILLNYGGVDDYRAAMWAQGFGGPLGFGILDDVKGDNHYYAGGMWRDSYPETPGYEGWSQGVGAGIRQSADGGIGVFMDGEGNNTYEFDYISHGGGYWCGMGFARHFGGNHQFLGSTVKNYYGGARTQAEFQRFSCGFGCHYALGFMFTDGGKNYYRGNIMGQGFGWDCAVGALCDFGGDDRFDLSGSSGQGAGAQASLGILFAYAGDHVYNGDGQGYANPGISYHHLPECGGNFSFLVDYGGNSQFGCGAETHSYNQRGSAGGFLIARPKNESVKEKGKDTRTQHASTGS